MSNQAIHKITLANGYCYILSNYLVITDHSDPKEILRRKDRNTLPLFLIFFKLISISALAGAIYLYWAGSGMLDVSILIIIMLFSMKISTRWKNKSNQKIIERSQIKGIELKKVMFNPTFLVHFKNEKGYMKERMLMMKANDVRNIDIAIKILRKEKLMSRQSVNMQEIVSTKDLAGSEKQSLKKIMQSKSIPEFEPETTKKPDKTYRRDTDGYMKDY